MAINAGNFALSVGLVEYESTSRQKAAMKTWDYTEIFGKPGKTGEAEIRGILFGGTGLPHSRNYGEPIRSDEMRELGYWSATDTEYAMGVDIDNKYLEDNRHIKGFMRHVGSSVGESFGQTKCIHAALPFIRAFSSTNQAMWDSSALCDSITLDDGTTLDNDLAVATPSFSSVWDMVDFIRYKQYTQRGLRRKGVPMCYLYHDVHERKIPKIFTQEWEMDSLYRNKNTLRKYKIKPVSCVELDALGTNAQFLLGTKAKEQLILRLRKNLTTEMDDNKRNRSQSMLTHMRIMVGVKDRTDIVGRPHSA